MTAVEPQVPLHDATLVRARLLDIAADVLELPGARVDPARSLWLQGLDSVRALELSAAVEDAFGVELDAASLMEHPTVVALVRHLCGRASLDATEYESPRDRFARMRADAVLPDDVRPSIPVPARTAHARTVLLTGATGFLGAWLLHSLLAETSVHVICLVRGSAEEALPRLRDTMHRYAEWDASFSSRIELVGGDIEAPGLGLSRLAYEDMAERAGAIYHAAAAVDWVRSYSMLRPANVDGTLALLRLACSGRTKPFHFVSSLAVCYSTRGPREVPEHHDPLAHLEGLHLGYAQTKSVAESLVRQAAARGLPATIYRPALVTGDTTRGAANLDDLVSRLLKGCIQLGAAPDLDWRLDAVPVDHAARAIVRLSRRDGDQPLRTFHLASERARHWRECVLWMNLRGYPMRLLPYREWAARLGSLAPDSDNALSPLRPFLLGRAEEPDALWLPQLFEESRRSRALSQDSTHALATVGDGCPAIDGRVLARYFDHFERTGFLPERPATAAAQRHVVPQPRDCANDGVQLPPPVLGMVGRSLTDERGAIPIRLHVQAIGGDDSIIAELTSWRGGRTSGLFRCTATMPDGSRRACVLKLRPEDREVIEVGEAVAGLCGDATGDAFVAAREHVGFTRGHLRELAVYGERDVRFTAHVPRVLATLRDDDAGIWAIAMEPLDDAVLMNADDDPARWHDEHVSAVVHGLSALHSVWLNKGASLSNSEWLPPRRTPETRRALEGLWWSLADYARPYFTDVAGHAMHRLHERCVASADARDRFLERMPRTLVHGDFNPRNIAVRRDEPAAALRLSAYDWELAAIDVPQRDLAELLCFVLGPHAERADADRWLTLHRIALERESGCPLDAELWRAGFVAALETFLVERLAMYTLVHHIRPQRFLDRVVRAWHHLYTMYA